MTKIVSWLMTRALPTPTFAWFNQADGRPRVEIWMERTGYCSSLVGYFSLAPSLSLGPLNGSFPCFIGIGISANP